MDISIDPPNSVTSQQLDYLDKLLRDLESEVSQGRIAPPLYTESERRYMLLETRAEASELIRDIRMLLGFE